MVRSYAMDAVICSIGAVTISGYGETDALTFEWQSDLAESMVTADGQAVYSLQRDRRLDVTIALSAKSRAVPLLLALLDVQHGLTLPVRPVQIVPLPFVMIDPTCGDKVSSAATIFMSRPAPNKGRTVSELEFRVQLPNALMILGAANLV